MTIFSQPIWIFVVNKFDKRTAVLSGLITMITGIAYIFVLFILRDNMKVSTMTLSLIPGLICAGGGMGALYSMPTGMLGDAIAVEKLHTKEMDDLFSAILTLDSLEECYKFFEDALTIKEILDTAQRLKAARMLKAGENYASVGKETGMSTATISRVSRCLEYGSGGYDMVIERMDDNRK